MSHRFLLLVTIAASLFSEALSLIRSIQSIPAREASASEWRMEYDVHDIRPISVHNKQTSRTVHAGSRGEIFIKPTCRLRACVAPPICPLRPFISMQFSFIACCGIDDAIHLWLIACVPSFFFAHILLIFQRQPFFVCAPSHVSAARALSTDGGRSKEDVNKGMRTLQ